MNVTYWQDQMLKSKNFDDLNRFRFWTTKTFAVVFAPQIISRRRESSPSSARCPWDSTTDGIKSVFLLSHSFCCSLMLKFKLSNNGYGKKLLKTTIHNLSYIIIFGVLTLKFNFLEIQHGNFWRLKLKICVQNMKKSWSILHNSLIIMLTHKL